MSEPSWRGPSWLDEGPEAWTKQYLGKQSLWRGVLAALAFSFMPRLGMKICPLCTGGHNLSKCPRWIKG